MSLIEHGPDVTETAQSCSRRTPSHLASFQGMLWMLWLLVPNLDQPLFCQWTLYVDHSGNLGHSSSVVECRSIGPSSPLFGSLELILLSFVASSRCCGF